MKHTSFEKSRELYEESKKYLLEGVGSSFHKCAEEEFAMYYDHGKGARLWDADGNEYIDYTMGFGPMILGYAHDGVNAAVAKQLERSSHYSAPTAELGQLAKKMCEIIPCAEKVVFQSSGTEADMYAFRVARAYTGRDKMVKFEGHYHGWADEQNLNFVTDDSKYFGARNNPWKIYNVPGQRKASSDDVVIVPWNDLEVLEQAILKNNNQIAGIIMEPSMFDEGPIPPQPGYLEGVRALCDKYGIVLIFDEVFTGFRMALGGAQEYFGVTPDIAVFAKAIAGGFCMSAVAGKNEIMESGATFSGCFNGNPIATAAGLVTLEELCKEGVYEKFQKLGDMFVEGMTELGKKHGIKLYAYMMGSLGGVVFGVDRPCKDVRDYIDNADIKFYNKVYFKAREYGMRLSYRRGRILLCTEHTEEDIKETIDRFDKIFTELAAE